MKKQFSLIVFMFTILNFYGQNEVCSTPDESSIDMNSISVTKCSIEPVKDSNKNKNRQIKVKISANRRFLKKRKVVKIAQIAKPVKLLENGIKANVPVEPTEIIEAKKTAVNVSESINKNNGQKAIYTLKKSINSLKEKLSKEEVMKASKLYYVDNIPTFKGCLNTKKSEELDCFNAEMIKHINKYFVYPSEAIRSQIQGEVWVRFIIDKNGYVRNVKAIGPNNGEILNEEAKRVVFELPNFKPAKNNGKTVSVKYGFPINFSLEE
ncbi:energy transducer TonB [Tenacibaculum bernardetii]|uniref:energy transducer TonB n=1 Tax=Tenacibaculum bernardetii TaxID=3021375 RepID=UPI0023AFCFBD|nr:energy transducer TonB [Tenacibaculum bernardetii]